MNGVKIELKVMYPETVVIVPLDELGHTADSWSELTQQECEDILEKYVDSENENNRPFWSMSRFITISPMPF